MIEPLAVAVHAVKQVGDVTGMNIAVLGAGPIGNLVAQTAKGMGEAMLDAFGPDKADVIYDSAGNIMQKTYFGRFVLSVAGCHEENREKEYI